MIGLAIGSDPFVQVGGVRDGVYRNAITGAEARGSGGGLSFSFKAHGAGV